MDHIRQALERARAANPTDRNHSTSIAPQWPLDREFDPYQPHESGDRAVDDIALNAEHLESHRIIAHDDRDFRARSFDMLRTQVLQAMDQNNWKTLGITSPSPGCGKTVTAINLAFSIARQPERSAFLCDLDLQRPQIATTLGLNCRSGLIGVLDGRIPVESAAIHASIGNNHIMVLPAESSTIDSSARMTSSAMSVMLQEIKRDYRSHTIIVDLPPMLSSDDVIAVLPQLDCILLVAAVGKSTVAEIDECNRHLRSAQVLRLVLNKTREVNANYYSYYQKLTPRR